MRYHIIGHDNRGSDTRPFGRIYLATSNDGECIGSIGYGAHRDDSDPYAVWPTRDTPTLGRDHSLAERAKEMLRELYPAASELSAEPHT